MTASIIHHDPVDDDLSNTKPPEYHYDLRLEIGVKENGDNVPVVAIFLDLIRRMKRAIPDDDPFVVLTASDNLFFEQNHMTSDEFQKAFQVDSIEGRNPKVLLGFKVRSTTKLSDIKQSLMHSYLIPHSLFLREHIGGFQDGVKKFNYGFLKQDHPDHPDIAALNKRFARICHEAWKTLDPDDKKKWKNDLPNIFFGSTGIMIPVAFSKERVSANIEGKDKVATTALVVSTPIKYGPLLKSLLDTAVLNKKITNLIPFALYKENPGGYYNILLNQEQFIENHRNIPISNIPPDAPNQVGSKGETLLDVLNSNTSVIRVSFDAKFNKYHVSTRAEKYRDLHKWISQKLQEHKFPYKPNIRPMKYGNKTDTSYSSVFQDAMTAPTEDASTIKTTRSNAWTKRPPLAISYLSTDAAFPPLPTTKQPVPATPSTMSETLDEDTIQSAISTALKKLEEQHQQELQQLRVDMQKRIADVEAQMKDLGQQVATQTYQALVKDESPLATKMDHAHLQQEISVISTQLKTLISMFQTGNDITTKAASSPARNIKRTKLSFTPEKQDKQDQVFTTQDEDYDHACSVSSAASTSDEGMEGCED